jgi:hypothetical protein
MYFSVQIQKIESKEANADLDVFNLDILSFPLAEFLKWQQFTSYKVNRNGFCIQHEGMCSVFEALGCIVSGLL